MKTLDKQFTNQELAQVAVALSHLGGVFAEQDDKYIGSPDWKFLWDLQQYFFSEANKEEIK